MIIRETYQLVKALSFLIESKSSEVLPKSSFQILTVLATNKSKENPLLSTSDLAGMLNVSPSAISRSLRNLEKNSFIQRDKKVDDRRQVAINITEVGELRLKQAIKDYQAYEKEILRHIPSEKLEIFFAVGRQMQEIIQESQQVNRSEEDL